MSKIYGTFKVIVSLLFSLLGGAINFVNEAIKPITDKTKTNKDNEIQIKISKALDIAYLWVGKVQTYINK